MILIFWISIFLIIYTYFLYPLLLKIISRFFKSKDYKSNLNLKLDFLIMAYNEEKVIESKILNTLKILEGFKYANIWIVSDGSSDKTNEIVKSYEKNKLINFVALERSGKSQAINKIIPKLKGDVIIFSDANIEYTTETISNLIKPYSDINVGCTCGKLVHRNPGNIVSGEGESFYWKYENNLKKIESKIGYVSGATGAVYSIRRNLFKKLSKNCINDDFTISMNVILKGYKCIYVEEAIVYENVAPTIKAEFKRHIRDATGHYISIIHLFKLINPFLGFKSLIFWSHRLIRWSVPFLLLGLFLINFLISNHPLYRLILICQFIFYFLAILGVVFSRKSKLPTLIFLPFYFCNLNLALFLGFLNSIFFRQNGMWNSTNR